MNMQRGALFRKPTPVAEPGAMLGKLMPELSVLLLCAWFLFAPDGYQRPDPDGLMLAVMVDGATLMLSATLVDVASRLRRPPRWWLGVLICAGILIMYPDAIALLREAWTLGLWVFAPFAWSILERMRELWTLPSASTIEKIRRRTLTFDRLYTALVVGGMATIGALLLAIENDGSFPSHLFLTAAPWVVMVFYAIAALNAWRVHTQAFATRPRSLWPWIDQGQNSYLNPL
jgi:hypothetical protein